MNILFLCYWGINEGLTRATVLPHLRILSTMDSIESIEFVTIEREEFTNSGDLPSKVRFTPIQSKNIPINILNKILDIRLVTNRLARLINQKRIDLIIGRSALAGAICYKLHKKSGIPFAVESFEPHANYMVESGVWKKIDPRYVFQSHWERMQKQSATMLMPVSNHYKEVLVSEGIFKSKVEVMPCAVDLELFKYSVEKRQRTRRMLNIANESIVGIYAGKFGGIYFDLKEAQAIMKNGFKVFKDFHLIILSQDSKDIKKAFQADENEEKIHILEVNHKEVPNYLSSADFAYNFHLPHKSSTFFSPIKNGEYWANGLPIILSDDIGDDSGIIQNTGFGAVFNDRDIDQPYRKIMELLDLENHRSSIASLAKKHRNFKNVEEIYNRLLSNIK